MVSKALSFGFFSSSFQIQLKHNRRGRRNLLGSKRTVLFIDSRVAMVSRSIALKEGKDCLLLTYFYIFPTKMLLASVDSVIADQTFKVFVDLSCFSKFV